MLSPRESVRHVVPQMVHSPPHHSHSLYLCCSQSCAQSFPLSQSHVHTWWLKDTLKRAFIIHACIRHLQMSLMVAEPGPTTSEKEAHTPE